MHADMCVHHVQNLASGSPYIVAGDFNIKPSEPVYKFLTTGELATTENPYYPAPPEHLPEYVWTPSLLEPVQSAYAVAKGTEPDFTNYARVREQEPFIDTLDYIFVGQSIRVREIVELPHRSEAAGPFPNAIEPSDHILIAADLDIETK